MSLQKNGVFSEKNQRQQQLVNWLSQLFNVENIELIALSGDAGFRTYYRFSQQNQSYIAVDAPDEYSNNTGFIELASCLKQHQLSVPQIVAHQRGSFFCLSDLGETLLSDVLTAENMTSYYQAAINNLVNIATASAPDNYPLPSFDNDFVFTELAIFTDWLLAEHLQLDLSKQEQASLQTCFEQLVEVVNEQPQVLMHRDYHSRNIMVANDKVSDNSLAIIDFQDAVKGPITYDLVSLLRDCYIRWPQHQIEPLVKSYYHTMQQKLGFEVSFETWVKWFDLTGLQRHIKAAGIFARLYHRDNKSGYLKDIPLTLSYIVDIAAKYPSLQFLTDLVSTKVISALEKQQEMVKQ